MSVSAPAVIAAFTEEQASRLTGVSLRQLRYWDRTAFFRPSIDTGATGDGRADAYSRLYSFRDLLSLRILNSLRNDAGVPLPHLREVKETLEHIGEDMWAKTTLYVLNRRVVFDNPETRAREEVVSGQGILGIPLKVVTSDMRAAVEQLRGRDETQIGHVTHKRNVVANQPVLAGTRIPVRSLKAFAEAGYTIEQIIGEYPTLTEADVRAALAHDEAA